MRKRIISIFCAILVLVSSLPVFASAAGIDHLIIAQVYGAGGKGESAISHSFIELYNPTAEAISLQGYTISYMSSRSTSDEHLGSTDGATVTLTLPEVTIPANCSYLIRCAAEENVTSAVLTMETYDFEWSDRYIDNSQYLLQLLNGEEVIDAVAVVENGGEGETPLNDISKQKSIRRKVLDNAFVDTNTNSADFEVIEYKGQNDTFVSHYAPKTLADGAWTPTAFQVEEPDPSFTAVQTTETQYQGLYNATATLQAQLSARYNAGAMNEDGGSAEIVAYNGKYQKAYIVNGTKGTLDCVAMDAFSSDRLLSLSGKEIDVKALVEGKDATFTYGDMTSVAISPDETMVAVSLQDADYSKTGRVVLFGYDDNADLTYKNMATTGIQPDMVVFADNNTVLTADEGEPREGTNGIDPKGSVTIVAVDTMTAQTVYFDSFDVQRENLTQAGVIIQKNTNPSTDFEPEYIAVANDGRTAYVALQEANAIAVLDIQNVNFTNVYPIGLQNYNEIKIDLRKNDAIDFENYNVYGIKMPDGISVYETGGKTYLLTANEGDSRADWDNLNNEIESATSPSGNLTLEEVVWFDVSRFDGLDATKDYIFGGRSFSMYEVTANGLQLVFDSGSDFEEITAECFAENFNCSNDKITLDNRSGKKGPEPEAVTIGRVGEKTYAFIALERIGGIMMYDITDPANTAFVNYINSRDFSEKVMDDVSPEGLCFVSNNTTQAFLLAACEVSGTMAVYQLTDSAQPVEEVEDNEEKNDFTYEEDANTETTEDTKEENPNTGVSNLTVETFILTGLCALLLMAALLWQKHLQKTDK